MKSAPHDWRCSAGAMTSPAIADSPDGHLPMKASKQRHVTHLSPVPDMRLSLQTDFARRTLMCLASKKGRPRATIADVAGFFQISDAHVAKVVNHLARLGFVRSIRGAGGGIELGREPAQIRVGEV